MHPRPLLHKICSITSPQPFAARAASLSTIPLLGQNAGTPEKITSSGEFTPKTYTADYKVINEVKKPGGLTTSRAKFVVEAGKALIHPA